MPPPALRSNSISSRLTAVGTNSHGNDIAVQAAVVRGRSQRLAGEVARLAGAIAATEDRVAAVLERLAEDNPVRAGSLLARAGDARCFAEHERREQERWHRVCESPAPGEA
jgi:hypothetical protein